MGTFELERCETCTPGSPGSRAAAMPKKADASAVMGMSFIFENCAGLRTMSDCVPRLRKELFLSGGASLAYRMEVASCSA